MVGVLFFRAKLEEAVQKEAKNALALEEQIRTLQQRLKDELDRHLLSAAALKKVNIYLSIFVLCV